MTDTPQQRLISLDVFRGMTIAGMILVNNPGSWEYAYAPLKHSVWNGCTPTDLVFPFFLFIVGVAITLSLSKRKERGDDKGKLVRKILFRTFLIFFVGLLLHAIPRFDLSTLRIPGVLQRIALVYGITSILFLYTSLRTQIAVAVSCLLGYWAMMTLIPVPGHGAPNLEPATNLAAWMDNTLLRGHLWGQTKIWDPEGLLSTIPAVGTGVAGLMLGHWLRTANDAATKTAWTMVAGALAVVVGIFWDIWFPMNKALWTSSYVMYVGGLAAMFFGTIYWVVDAQRVTWFTKPFTVFGTNAIAAYVFAWLLEMAMWEINVTGAAGTPVPVGTYLYTTFFTPHFAPLNASLAWAVCQVLIALGAMWVLHARKIFIRL
jgi:predicted acyltransferase